MASMIMPSGGKKYDWIPKLAEDETIGVDALSDEDLEELAAPSDIEVDEVEIEEPGETPEEDVVEVSIEDENGIADEISEEEDLEGGSLAQRVDELIEVVEEAKEGLEEIALEVSDDEMEELDEELDEELEGEFEESPVEEIADEDVLVSITPGETEELGEECETCQYCGNASGMSSVAGDSRRFVKIAAISPENKDQLKKYWVDYYGYDKDYVKWMLEDYEK